MKLSDIYREHGIESHWIKSEMRDAPAFKITGEIRDVRMGGKETLMYSVIYENGMEGVIIDGMPDYHIVDFDLGPNAEPWYNIKE